MDTIKTGGPASPFFHPDDVCGVMSEGMTLRDYFAIHAEMRTLIEADGFIPQRIAINIMGSDPPNWDNDVIAATQWWCQAEARVRYMKADAMIAARGA